MTYVSTVATINMILLFVIVLVIIGVVIGVYITLSTINTLILDIDKLVLKIDKTATNAVANLESTIVNGYINIVDKCIAN